MRASRPPPPRRRRRQPLRRDVRGGLADLRRDARGVIDEGPQRTVHRYLPLERRRGARAPPVLLVPPLAAPAICFDLRRGCSLAEHLLRRGRPTYLVDYGEIEFSDRDARPRALDRGRDPEAIRAASRGRRRAAGPARRLVPGRDPLAARARGATRRCRSAASRWSRARSTSRQVPLVAPLRPIAAVTQGCASPQLYRAARRRAGAAGQARLPARRRSTST